MRPSRRPTARTGLALLAVTLASAPVLPATAQAPAPSPAPSAAAAVANYLKAEPGKSPNQTGQPAPVTPTPATADALAPAAPNPANAAPPPPELVAIRARLAQGRERELLATADELKGLHAFYTAHYATEGSKPVFANADGLTPLARRLLAEIARADDWGLPSAELKPAGLPAEGQPLAEAAIADAEVRMALACLKYARYARGGRIPEPSRQLASYIDRAPQLADPKSVLDTLATATDPEAALRGYNPQSPAFEALRKAYLQARDGAAAGSESVRAGEFPSGPNLKPGGRHPHVALLRRWLKVEPAKVDGQVFDAEVYDPALADAVVAFQQKNGLEPADGIVGSKTRAALSSLSPPSARRLLANMEQWRWMPADLGETYIQVNIPEFTLRMVSAGQVIHTERVVTGLVTNQTPIFSDKLATVVLQPDWVLPMSIKVNEAIPSLLSGSGMFYSSGLRIKKGSTEIDPYEVDWGSADVKNYTFYQPPGETNALGQVKFLFPNKHAVYMHDTPSKNLFNSQVRAFSHGCMRVRNPVRLAELVLGRDKGWSAEEVRELVTNGPEDNKVALDHKIPVHITYFTAVPDEASGAIKTFPDIYGHEKRIALALDGRWGEIDIPPDHLAPVEDREFEFRSAALERRRERDEQKYYGNGGGGGVDSIFKSLFGGL